MYQENDLELYRQIKAPAELKTRISSAVKRRQKKQRTTWVAVTASIALMISVNGWMHSQHTILSINEKPVTYHSVELQKDGQEPWLICEGTKQKGLIQIPMEIDVAENAHIEISEGTLQQSKEQETVMEMDISEKTVIYWTLDANTMSKPICTITVGEETYRYEIFIDERKAVYAMRKLK